MNQEESENLKRPIMGSKIESEKQSNKQTKQWEQQQQKKTGANEKKVWNRWIHSRVLTDIQRTVISFTETIPKNWGGGGTPP